MISPARVLRNPELEAVLGRYMNECALRGPVYAFEEVASTMEEAHALAMQAAPEGTLIVAKRQNRGRGRLGRTWESPEGGAYCSIIVRPQRATSEIPQLSLVAGLAVVEGLRQLTHLHPSIRWPNDVLVEGKKLAGILVEAKSGAVVIGIGVNVAVPVEALPDTATSLAVLLPRSLYPHQVIGALWRRFSSWYDVWTLKGFGPIREALRPLLGLFGEVVHIAAGSSRFEGTATDLDEAGRLLVRLDSGIVRPFEVGEVTLLR